jgi:hypothetical protein
MRVVSLIVAAAGVIVFILAVLSVLVPLYLGITPGGLLRGTISLFLMAITCMMYDKAYPRKPAAPKQKRR